MNTTYLEGYNSISACLKSESREIYKILIDEKLKEKKPKALFPLKTKAEKKKIEIEYVSSNVLEELATGKTHGGVIALCGDRRFLSTDELLKKSQKGFLVYLEGIEDPFNFGQAIRAIYAAGADGVLLPKRNWMSASATVARASAGASELIPAALIEQEEISFFKEKGYRIICSDLTETAVDYTDANLKFPILLVIGGEKRGISASVSKNADETIKIAYGRDFNMSLGASEAAGILAFEILRQNK
jgi:23S rRNA (guanosine2251-2'-O)-methyltransferase